MTWKNAVEVMGNSLAHDHDRSGIYWKKLFLEAGIKSCPLGFCSQMMEETNCELPCSASPRHLGISELFQQAFY